MGAYIDGSRENLDTMDKMLLSLEQNPANLDAIEEIFRAAHTLKGMSATMGFEKIAQLTHEMETILDKLRSREIGVTAVVIDIIFETFDVLRTLVNDSIESTDSNIDISELSAKLSSIGVEQNASPAGDEPHHAISESRGFDNDSLNFASADLSDMEFNELELNSLQEAETDGRKITLLQVSLVADCLLKGPRVFMILRTLDDMNCEVIKSLPDVKDLENEKFDRSFKMVVITDSDVEELRDAIESISEIEKVIATTIASSDAASTESAAITTNVVPPAPPKTSPPPAQNPQSTPEKQKVAPKPPATAASPTAKPQQARQPEPAKPLSQGGFAAPPESFQTEVFTAGPQNMGADNKDSDPDDDEDKQKEIIELVQLVTFTMAGETYALEIQEVEAIINLVPITRVPKAPTHIDGVINLRGEIVPVINTRRRLKLSETDRKPSNQIIILSFEEEKVKAGFLVDSVQEVIRLQESAIEPPSRVSEGVNVEYLRGVGKIDNKIIILLNAHRIVFGKQSENN